MNNIYNNLKKLVAIAAISLVSFPAYAQLGDVGQILQAGANDANLLANEYLKPIGRGFGAGLNSGWYFGANPHKFLGFDVSVRVGLAQVPTADQTYDVSSMLSKFQRLEVANGVKTGPTLSGEETASRPVFGIYEDDPYNPGSKIELASFEMPDGVGAPYVPTAMVQASVGLILSTDVTVRYMPTTELEDFGSIGLMGASVKHSLNQWIPGGDFLPVDLAVQAGFTELTAESNLSIKPADIGYNSTNTANSFPDTQWDGQKVEFKSSGYTVNALVGKNINLLILGIGVYGGIGFESATTTVSTPGNYPILTPNDNVAEYISGKEKKVQSISTPLDLSFDSANSMRYTLGARVRFLLINVVAEYTYANYQMINAGIAISLR